MKKNKSPSKSASKQTPSKQTPSKQTPSKPQTPKQSLCYQMLQSPSPISITPTTMVTQIDPTQIQQALSQKNETLLTHIVTQIASIQDIAQAVIRISARDRDQLLAFLGELAHHGGSVGKQYMCWAWIGELVKAGAKGQVGGIDQREIEVLGLLELSGKLEMLIN